MWPFSSQPPTIDVVSSAQFERDVAMAKARRLTLPKNSEMLPDLGFPASGYGFTADQVCKALYERIKALEERLAQ